MQAVTGEVLSAGRPSKVRPKRVPGMGVVLLPLKFTLSPMEDVSVIAFSNKSFIPNNLARLTLCLQLSVPHP